MKLAYIMSRFPKLTETFVLFEILAVESLGARVEIFPLLRERQRVRHPEAARLAQRAHFQRFLSWPVLCANARLLLRNPRRYFGIWGEVLRRTWGSLNFFLGALACYPKAVWFAEEMRRLGVEHIHAHFANHPALVAYVVNQWTGIPYSFTAHGSDLHVERRMLDRKVEAASFVVAVSAFNKEMIVRESGEQARDKIHILHCGIDTEAFSLARAKHNGPFQILCVASFEAIKGHQYLVNACALLRDLQVAFECKLVGDGPLLSRTREQIASAGLTEKVKILGPRPRHEVIQLLSCADAFVLPSHPTKAGKREGIPVALMEAMACGLPVVTTATGGIPELVHSGRSGFVVPPGDVPALATSLQRLAQSPELRKRMGMAGREMILKEFHLKKSAQKLLQLFEKRGQSPVVTDVPPSREAESVGVLS